MSVSFIKENTVLPLHPHTHSLISSFATTQKKCAPVWIGGCDVLFWFYLVPLVSVQMPLCWVARLRQMVREQGRNSSPSKKLALCSERRSAERNQKCPTNQCHPIWSGSVRRKGWFLHNDEWMLPQEKCCNFLGNLAACQTELWTCRCWLLESLSEEAAVLSSCCLSRSCSCTAPQELFMKQRCSFLAAFTWFCTTAQQKTWNGTKCERRYFGSVAPQTVIIWKYERSCVLRGPLGAFVPLLSSVPSVWIVTEQLISYFQLNF